MNHKMSKCNKLSQSTKIDMTELEECSTEKCANKYDLTR